MRQTFWVKNEHFDAVKSLVRQHKSLRFIQNPLQVGNTTEFCLQGDVEDFNSLDRLYEDLVKSEVRKTRAKFLGMLLGRIWSTTVEVSTSKENSKSTNSGPAQ